MKIRYIVSMSGLDVSYPAHEKNKAGHFVYYDCQDLEAVRLIDAEIAVPKDEAEYVKAKANIEALQAEKEKNDKLAKDLANLETLKEQRIFHHGEFKRLDAEIKEVEALQK